MRSPCVTISTGSTSSPGYSAFSWSATQRVCTRASLLRRVAIRMRMVLLSMPTRSGVAAPRRCFGCETGFGLRLRRSRLDLEPEQPSHGLDQLGAAADLAVLFELGQRRVQELIH